MSSQVSSSDRRSSSFELLDPRIQRWIWSKKWTELRDAQEQAIPLLLNGCKDIIIAASTASGKTEAAFFPILTRLAAKSDTCSLALYISPLKALINDQWSRLEILSESMEIKVTPWHGDIAQGKKTTFLKSPHGCLLITPESLEAMLIRKGHGLESIFSGLGFIVVDELHSFMGTERGKQLQSLLHRIEIVLGRQVCRIGLSATLGDMAEAAEYLRPGSGERVAIVNSDEGGQELLVLVKGLLERSRMPLSQEGCEDSAIQRIANDLFKSLRGTNNLVFPNSREMVETLADSLRRKCDDLGAPNEFWPHHGNLSKEVREETEAALKRADIPATAICTNTLELGIDIGAVKSVAQVHSPPSVAGLRQRLGRSGRNKGDPAILRCFCIERDLDDDSSISSQLREGLIQTAAMVTLLVEGWFEPGLKNGIHASTLVQQCLSAMAQYGGLMVGQLWNLLCCQGPFQALSKDHFLSLIHELGIREIIFQDSTGLLLLAPKGERIVEHYSFFAAFASQEEFRIVTSGKTLGSIPIERPMEPGSFLIFAGRRWLVQHVFIETRTIEVEPARAGAVPHFDGTAGIKVHDRVRERMREILQTESTIPFLDPEGQVLLQQARYNYHRLELDKRWIIEIGRDTHLLLWKGDWVLDTIQLMLNSVGCSSSVEGISVVAVGVSIEDVLHAIKRLLSEPRRSASILASSVENMSREKWDWLLPNDLLCANYASLQLDIDRAYSALSGLPDPGRFPKLR